MSLKIATEFGTVNLRKRGNSWVARKQYNGERFEETLKARIESEAIEEATQWIGFVIRGRNKLPIEVGLNAKSFSSLFSSARKRAKLKGIEYSITEQDANKIASESKGCCALTGIQFHAGKRDSFRAPFAPSVDRINPAKGYTASNVRLVCVAVNWALSDWGEAVFLKICAGYSSRILRESAGL